MLYQLEHNDAIETPTLSLDAIIMPNNEETIQLDQQVIEHHLSYNAMYGTKGPATIRVRAQINSMEIQALTNGRSSNSFIQPRIAKFLNLIVQLAPGFRVMVGNFELMTTEGCIPSLEVTMQGYKVQIPEVYVVNVAGGGFGYYMAQEIRSSYCGLSIFFHLFFA